MIKLTFTDPLESPIENVWHNMDVADKTCNLNIFVSAAQAWLKLNPDKNYQNLEEELRKKNFNTHLFAVKPTKIEGTYIGMINNYKTDFEWECFFSCRSKELALKEVLTHASTYEENFERLLKAGCILSEINDNESNNDQSSETSKKLEDGSTLKMLDKDTIDDMSLITNNKKKVVLEKISGEVFLNQIIVKLKGVYGKEPEHSLIAMAYDGAPIFALTIDKKIVSEWGFSVRHYEPKFEIINITQFFK